jgi:PITH domain
MPTFMVFKNGSPVETIKGADPGALQTAVKKLAAEADALDGGSSSGGFGESSSFSSSGWIGRELPRGYKDITDQLDVKGLDLLNADPTYATARGLFAGAKPSSLSGGGKGKGKLETEGEKDWVESDTDEQLMLFMPFQSTLKIHTLQITSCPPTSSDDDDAPMRPKTLQLYSNRAHVLGFDEAESISATQEIVLAPGDWDAETQTAKVELRFVKFQNVTSLVLFVVDGEGDGDKVRIDRIRVIGESGEKRDMGKLEKVGEGE